MSQLLASHVDRLQGFTKPFIADTGTLVIRDDQGLWYYHGTKWEPSKGLTNQQWCKLFHKSPPMNIQPEHWGIVNGLTDDIKCRDCNWNRPEIAAALTSFIDDHFGVHGDGFSLRPAGKARHLSRKRRDRIERILDEVMRPA